VDFDGTGEYLIADNRVIAADDVLSLHVVATFNNLSARGRVVGSLFYVDTSNNGGFSFESNVFNNSNGIAGYGNDTLVTHDAEDTVTQGEEELYSLQLQSGTSNWYVNGTLEDSVSTGMNAEDGGNLLTIGAGQAGTSPHNGSIKEIILYNSDQSDNRTAIEANIGETYGITAIPAANDTVNGFVQTWYDQSGGPAADPENITGFTITGSGADATYTIDSTSQGDKISFTGGSYNIRFTSGQWRIYEGGDLHHYSAEDVNYPWDVTSWTTTSDGSGTPVFGSFVGGSPTPYPANDAEQIAADKQPKIVDGGALVTRNINGTASPSIKFGASNEMIHGITSLSADGQQSLFFVADNQVTSGNSTRLLEIMSSTADEGRRRRPLIFKDVNQSIVFSVDSLSGIEVTAANSDQVSTYSSITKQQVISAFHTVYQDGTQVGSAIVTLDANPTVSTNLKRLGNLASNAVGNFYFTEIVYYNSDQTDNRTAIETNIANHYGITLS
jgi:hypothetical protein